MAAKQSTSQSSSKSKRSGSSKSSRSKRSTVGTLISGATDALGEIAQEAAKGALLGAATGVVGLATEGAKNTSRASGAKKSANGKGKTSGAAAKSAGGKGK